MGLGDLAQKTMGAVSGMLKGIEVKPHISTHALQLLASAGTDKKLYGTATATTVTLAADAYQLVAIETVKAYSSDLVSRTKRTIAESATALCKFQLQDAADSKSAIFESDFELILADGKTVVDPAKTWGDQGLTSEAQLKVILRPKDKAWREKAEDQLMTQFRSLDADKSGTISRDELVSVFVKCGISKSDAKKLFKAADSDGNGELSFEEFASWLLKRSGAGKK
eukprot:CAMPEP_0197639054 /NCGR_PEP_ID=MMETSP1338-20131121/13798_1 /TAXON_ID=43686 ORGANISM="Pelagodinium beii, Strain RCC1491" /NCGR_SAMPLE_ID=MMETSP1338 /ASSEMBLY_ACC=CAM_ASM_000754 /LENGTH=224 /DNA_ID=CAMNT_0043211729 /DNA_START=44 /DNA_END=718 /DNA_ORIENTATION=+